MKTPTEYQIALAKKINNSPILNLPPEERCSSSFYMKFVNDVISLFNDRKRFYSNSADISQLMQDGYTKENRKIYDPVKLIEAVNSCLRNYKEKEKKFLAYLGVSFKMKCKGGDKDMVSLERNFKMSPDLYKTEKAFDKYLSKYGDWEHIDKMLREELASMLGLSIEELSDHIEIIKKSVPALLSDDHDETQLPAEDPFSDMDDIETAWIMEKLIPFVQLAKGDRLLKRRCYYSFLILYLLRQYDGMLSPLSAKERKHWAAMEEPYVLTIIKNGHTFQKIAFTQELLRPLEANKTISEYITEVTGNACNKGRITELKVAFAAEVKRIGELAN